MVHCKMGISRSGSTVVAYAMKQQHWPLDAALAYVKERRSIVKPNEAFMKQLQTYDGILKARWDPRTAGGTPAERILIHAAAVPASSATVHSGGDAPCERRREGMA